MTKKLTPAMQQYVDLKKQHPDCILFFRLGDFYEMFREDAQLASKLLDLTLTSKNKNAPEPIPMAGIPHHSADKYIQRLMQHGYKVAIAEQTSIPKPGKLVQRAIAAIVTPGTYVQEKTYDHNYLLAIVHQADKQGHEYHAARGDIAIGHMYTKSFASSEAMIKRLTTQTMTEIITAPGLPAHTELTRLTQHYSSSIAIQDIPYEPTALLERVLGTSTLKGYGQAVTGGRGLAVSLLCSYMCKTLSKDTLTRVTIHYQQPTHQVLLDHTTIKNLELFASSYDGNTDHSLFGVLNTCATHMGARLLQQRLLYPTNNTKTLIARQDHIQLFVDAPARAQAVHTALKQVQDVPKLIGTIVYRKAMPSLLARCRNNLALITSAPVCDELLAIGCAPQAIETTRSYFQILATTLKTDIRDETSNYIADGIDPEIDRQRQIAFHSDDLLIQYQGLLREHSACHNTKVKYVRNIGYVIEVTPKEVETFEATRQATEQLDFVRRQTLKTGQRYTTPYLESIQQDILRAQDKLITLERQVLQTLIDQLEQHRQTIITCCDYVARLDLVTAHALYTRAHVLIRPTLSEQGTTTIRQGRHPVIERFLSHDTPFIPNDVAIAAGQTDDAAGSLHIITGPNMGGKSTFLRQNALIVLLAHCGLFVPAQTANIRTIDALFARVGSGDAIAKNQSTFMTEMIEVANILNNATDRSFIVFDELGRGTATYDGLALSKAILQYVATHIQASTLVATHYHELIALEDQLPNVRNFSVSVYETDKEVVFLKKIAPGGADKSYGVEVAKLAGIPQPITQLAQQYLTQLEDTAQQTASVTTSSHALFPVQLPTRTDVEQAHYDKIMSLVNNFDVNTMTPLQALQLLAKIQGKDG